MPSLVATELFARKAFASFMGVVSSAKCRAVRKKPKMATIALATEVENAVKFSIAQTLPSLKVCARPMEVVPDANLRDAKRALKVVVFAAVMAEGSDAQSLAVTKALSEEIVVPSMAVADLALCQRVHVRIVAVVSVAYIARARHVLSQGANDWAKPWVCAPRMFENTATRQTSIEPSFIYSDMVVQ